MGSRTTPGPQTRRQVERLRDMAATFPEATEDHPWGETAMKVRGKVFLFLGATAEGLSLSVKLPQSQREALLLPFTEPTGYGLGKSGWVTARFGPAEKVPLGTLGEWIEESFRAVAPKRVVALLDGLPEGRSAGTRSVRKKA